MNQARPFAISKKEVWNAYQEVSKIGGAGGVDGQSIEDFEKDLKNNLYKIWNRMSSGSYFPSPIRTVPIPKKDGGQRLLGIPTVSDRIAQMVVKRYLEPSIDPYFHEDSYGYRPKKSAHDAVATAKQRCWKYNWVIDLDIKGFFDNIDHGLLLKAVHHHTKEAWINLYIKRWLQAPVQTVQGNLEVRNKGTPQGGVVSPLLANLYLHYVFDEWMKRTYSRVPFERFADDIVIHAVTLAQAEEVKSAIEQRMIQCGLSLHPTKTKIVYCKDDKRPRETTLPTSFNFLGFKFTARTAKGKHRSFNGFMPAISPEAKKAMCQKIKSWRIHRICHKTIIDLANMFNPVIRGWFNYYGKFYKSGMDYIYWQLQKYLTRWVLGKYKSFRHHRRKAYDWLLEIMKRQPNLFAHWQARRKQVA